MSTLTPRIQALFGGAALISDGASPFYAKGAPIDNPFYPFYNRQTNEIVVLTPDPEPSTLKLLRDSLESSLSQVFMSRVPLTTLQKWSTLVFSPYDQKLHEFSGRPSADLSQPGMVYLGVAALQGSMARHKDAIDEVLGLTHAATALALIGCSPTVEKTQ
jgi:hypothetical protein